MKFKKLKKSALRTFLKVLKKVLFIGVISWFSLTILMLAISFTSLPFWGIHHLSKPGSAYSFEPEYIIFMGGSGFPGKSSLMRIYYTSKLAHEYPEAKIIAAFPGDPKKSNGMLSNISREFKIRGIDSTRIIFEPQGTNTRWQAMEIKENIITNPGDNMVIVSSPAHIYRAVKVFSSLGFKNIGSFACFERNINVSLQFDSEDIEGKAYLPDIGANQQLRYQFWNHLKYEIVLLREYAAITYYFLQGWI